MFRKASLRILPSLHRKVFADILVRNVRSRPSSSSSLVPIFQRIDARRNIFISTSLLFSSDKSPKADASSSKCRQNYSNECEAQVNQQINLEFHAGYVYLSMAYYFDRDDVALPGLHRYLKKASEEEREHVEKLMKYQNQRGGRIVLQSISEPPNNGGNWGSPLQALKAALELEKTVNDCLLHLHALGSQHKDPHICDFLETHFLEEQVKQIKELADLVTQLERYCDNGLGEYMFDKLFDKENPKA